MKVEIYNRKVITDFSQEEAEIIKKDLTLDNPQYINAKKHSGYSRISLPKYIRYYTSSGNLLTVPIGYDIPFEYTVEKDERVEFNVDYPSISIEPRETQEKALESYLNDTEKGTVVMSTGKGKSILGIFIAYYLRQKTLIIVHKNDLVDGWNKDIQMAFDDKVKPGLIKAKSRKVGEQFTIATIQTLSRMDEKELHQYTKQFGLIIGDECHHTPSSTYDLINEFYSAYRVGLTATPERNDGLDTIITTYFGSVGFKYDYVVEDEDILPVQVNCRTTKLFYMPKVIQKGSRYEYVEDERLLKPEDNPISIKAIPYAKRPKISNFSLDSKLCSRKYFEIIYGDLKPHYDKGRSCLMFLLQKEKVRELRDYLVEKGIPEEHIQLYYGDSSESDSELKRRAESKEVYITISTYSKATEGTNVKAWEVAFMVSSINNGKGVEQAVGRVRRAMEGKINPVLVYDYEHPNFFGLFRHWKTRYQRYAKLKFKVKKDKRKSFFSKGYRG